MVDLLHLASSVDNSKSYFEIINQIKFAFCCTSKKLSVLADRLHEELCTEFANANRELTDIDIVKFLFLRYCQSEGVQMFLPDKHDDLAPVNMNNWIDVDVADVTFIIREQEHEVDIYHTRFQLFQRIEIFVMNSEDDVDSVATVTSVPVPTMSFERREIAIKAIIAEFSGKFERKVFYRGQNRSPSHRSLSTPS